MDSSLQLQILMENYSKLETKLEEMNEKFNLQQKQIEELSELKEKFQESVNLPKSETRETRKTSETIKTSNASNASNASNNKLSIIFSAYKKSILVSNMYSDSNGNSNGNLNDNSNRSNVSTQNYKEHFKKLEAKWFTNKELNIKGWLFVGKLRGTLEESSKSIIEYFEKICELEYQFNN